MMQIRSLEDKIPRKRKRGSSSRRRRRAPSTSRLMNDVRGLHRVLYDGLVDAEPPQEGYSWYTQRSIQSSYSRTHGHQIVDTAGESGDKTSTSIPQFTLPTKRYTKLAILTAEMSGRLMDFRISSHSNINNSLSTSYRQYLSDYNVQVEMPKGSAYTSVYSDPAMGGAALRTMCPAWIDRESMGVNVYSCPRNWIKYMTKARCWRTDMDRDGRTKSDLRGPAWFCSQHTLPAPVLPFQHVPLDWGNVEVYHDAEYNCKVAIFRPTTEQAIKLWRRNHRFVVFLNENKPLGKIDRVTTGLHEAYDAYVKYRLADVDVTRADTMNARGLLLLELNAEKKNPAKQDAEELALRIEAGEITEMSDSEFNWFVTTFDIPAVTAAWMLSMMRSGQMSREQCAGVISRMAFDRMKTIADMEAAGENTTPHAEYGSVGTLDESQLNGLYFAAKNVPITRTAEFKDLQFMSPLGTTIKEYVAPVAPRESMAYYKAEYERLALQFIQQILGKAAAGATASDNGGASSDSINAALGSSTGGGNKSKGADRIDKAAGISGGDATETTVDVLMAQQERDAQATRVIKDIEAMFIEVYREICEAHDMAFVAEFRSALFAKLKELSVLATIREYCRHGGNFPESGKQLTQPLDWVSEMVGVDSDDEDSDEDDGETKEEDEEEEEEDETDLDLQIKLQGCMDGIKRLMTACEHILAFPANMTIELSYESPQPMLSTDMLKAVDDVTDKRDRKLKEERSAAAKQNKKK